MQNLNFFVHGCMSTRHSSGNDLGKDSCDVLRRYDNVCVTEIKQIFCVCLFVCLIIQFTFQLFAGHLTPNVYLLKNFMSLYTHVLSSFSVTCFFHLVHDLPVGCSLFTPTFETFCGCSSY